MFKNISCKGSYCKPRNSHNRRFCHLNNNIIIIQVTVSTPSRPKAWVRELSDEESKLGRALAGGHVPSIAKAIVRNSALKEAVFLELLDQLDRECSVLCRTRDASFFCKVPLSMLEEFCWDKFVDELQHKSPVLLQVMSSITSRNDHRNKSKSGKVHFPGICMAAATFT